MTTLHIIRSALEFFGILLAAYAVYWLSVAKETDKPQKPRTDAHSEKAVVFGGRDIFYMDIE